MTLREQQSLFVRLLGELLAWASAQPGWALTLGEAWRPVWVAEEYARRGLGIRNSLHTDRLAADLNLFVDGEYISDGAHPAWERLGKHWESLHELARWGGRFGDANHVSLTRGGRA